MRQLFSSDFQYCAWKNMIFLKLACPERFGTQGTAKPNCRTPGGASVLVKILM